MVAERQRSRCERVTCDGDDRTIAAASHAPLVAARPARRAARAYMNRGAAGCDAARSHMGSIILEEPIRRRKVRRHGGTMRSAPIMFGQRRFDVFGHEHRAKPTSLDPPFRYSAKHADAAMQRPAAFVSGVFRKRSGYPPGTCIKPGHISANVIVYDINALAMSDAMPAGSANITDSAILFRIRARATSREPRARRD